jgi:TFIIF-interacting CTD phosphatase-like protein
VVDTKENIDDYFKDINLLNRDLSKIVYVDTKAVSFWPHPENSVPVSEFMADSTVKDRELLTLIDFLEEIKKE